MTRTSSAKDDAAGQAIANRMSSQITGLSQAQRNANDGISVAQTTEGALNQVNDNLQRIRELSVQAQNGTNSADDLKSIQNEIGQRLSEINRISEETNFNGVKVLQEDNELKIQVGAKDNETISLNLEQINKSTLGLASFDVSQIISSDNLSAEMTSGSSFNVSKTASIQTNSYSPEPLTATGVYAKSGGGYAVKASDEKYYDLATNPVTGQLTWDSATPALDEADVDVAGGALTSATISSSDLPAAINDANTGTTPSLAGGVTLDGDLYLRNDEAATTVDTYAIDFNGQVASGESLVAYTAADNTVQYAITDGTNYTSVTIDATSGQITGRNATPDLGDTSAGAVFDSASGADAVANGDNVVKAGTDLSTVSYGNYATKGSDDKYYAVNVGVDTAAAAADWNAADASSWDLTATVDETAMQEVSSGNIAPGGAVTEVATANVSVSSNADLLQLADEAASPMAVTQDGLYALADESGYVVKGSDGNYYAADVADDGSVSWDSSSEAVTSSLVTDDGTGADAVTKVVTDVEASATFEGLEAGESLHEITDNEGNGTGTYVVKGGTEENPTYTYAKLSEPDVDGKVTVTKETNDDGSLKGATVDPMSMLDNAISKVDSLRSDLGAIQNRFESAITNLSTTETNLSAARSRIEDADYATEVANMTRSQILQQAGTSVLAQANQLPQSVLSLLG
ncbi:MULTISPECIES: flagellin [unclassified Halomonas]|uniref:flagellin N-terminal helical domain-containing protein n=1 Tax=unclassified Halomonas TaxID=2609666 RepID=UPI0023B83629|nr:MULTISPECIES: flagellin [unclassified Halomonas]